MFSFQQYMIETFTQRAPQFRHGARIKASGVQSDRHIRKYVQPYVGSNEYSHITAAAHGSIPANANIKISRVKKVAVAGDKQVYHVNAEDDRGHKELMPVSKIYKTGHAFENRGHIFEQNFVRHLKKHNLMDANDRSAGSSAGSDFKLVLKKPLVGKVQSGGAEVLNGEAKKDHRAAMGQLTIHHTKEKLWHIPEFIRENRPKYAEAITKSGILAHMNKHHADPAQMEKTESGRAKTIVKQHPNMNPGIAYLHDHRVDVLHVGGGNGTYAIGKDKTGQGLPPLTGKGKWEIRHKHLRAGDNIHGPRRLTVQFRPNGFRGLTPSHVNLENPEHIKRFQSSAPVK